MEPLNRRGLWTVFLVLALALSACARTPPEEKLRQTLAGLQGAIERHDAGAVDEVLAEDFIGPGGLDRAAARRMAQGMFLRYRDVGVTAGPLHITMRPGDAYASFTAALTGGAGALPSSGQVFDVETVWRLESGEWRLVNANWKARL